MQLLRENYDRLADEYARHLFEELAEKPLDRQLLDRFAAEAGRRGKVCDMGCGPGQVARYLRDCGADVFGLDFSPGMLRAARHLNPEIPFVVGDMAALCLQDQSLSGIAAFYAIVNLPEHLLRKAFSEMERVLSAGGFLLLSFHIGREKRRVEELWGQRVSMDFYFFETGEIRKLLEDAGLHVREVIEREPYAPAVEHQSRRAYIFADKQARI